MRQIQKMDEKKEPKEATVRRETTIKEKYFEESNDNAFQEEKKEYELEYLIDRE